LIFILISGLFRVLSWLNLLAHKDSEKEEKPEQNHQEQRDNGDEQAAEICPRVLIPRVRLWAIGTLSFACQKRALASGANFDCHAFRISKFTEKFNGSLRVAQSDLHFHQMGANDFSRLSW
jgi:hypothetical protein